MTGKEGRRLEAAGTHEKRGERELLLSRHTHKRDGESLSPIEVVVDFTTF